ncbi:MAG TPA: hypothetical protein V6C84_12190 [Coleofasciculaceae cyanobacterium]|jgi:Ca2+-binding RTX toxin-like protein
MQSSDFFSKSTGKYNVREALKAYVLEPDEDGVFLKVEPVAIPVQVGTAGNDMMQGSEKMDGQLLTGGEGHDIILGNRSTNIDGGNGNDLLFAGPKGRTLGGGGNDVIMGSFESVLTGGAGKDIFALGTIRGNSKIRITDFGKGDQIYLQRTASLMHGFNLKEKFVLGSKAQDSNDRLIFNKQTGALVFDGDGNGRGKGFTLATFKPGSNITASSIVVYAY